MKRLLKGVLAALFRKRLLLRTIKGAGKTIALTFDDGPHAANTPRLLALLRDRGVRATFFLLGSEVQKYPGLLSEIRSQGHEIGNHGFSHGKVAELGFRAYRKDLLRSAELIASVPPSGPCLYFRPPYGELNLDILRLLLFTDIRLAYWTVDSMDSYVRDKALLERQMSETPVRGGDILLFHEDYETTLEALPAILDDLKARGFKFSTLSGMTDKTR